MPHYPDETDQPEFYGPKCDRKDCRAPAACFGRYEGFEGYSCDRHCAHGCEDGHCVLLPEEVTRAD